MDERASAFVFLEEDRGGESRDSAADGDEVVDLAGVSGVGDSLFERAVAQRVPGGKNFPGVAVGVCVVADSAVAVKRVFGRDRRGFVVEKEPGAG